MALATPPVELGSGPSSKPIRRLWLTRQQKTRMGHTARQPAERLDCLQNISGSSAASGICLNISCHFASKEWRSSLLESSVTGEDCMWGSG